MKLPAISIIWIIMTFNSYAQNISFEKVKIQNNSGLFKIQTIDKEENIILDGNKFDASIDPFTGMEKSNSRDAKVFLIGEEQTDYIMTAEMRKTDAGGITSL